MTGSWNINVVTGGKLPQKVATAMSALSETMLGAEYEPIAVLGTQVVNGTNYAVLAKQTILSGKDTVNVVVMIFNEKPNDEKATLVNIERVLESNEGFGGTIVEPSTDINIRTKEVWDTAFEGWVGSKVEPIAFLGSQMTKGESFIYAATVTPVVPDAQAKVAIVTINPMTKEVSFVDMLETKQASSLGYAFTW